MKKIIGILAIFILANTNLFAQLDSFKIDYKDPKKYKIAGLEIEGTKFLDKNIIRSLTGLKTGQEITIPGDDLTKCIKALWKQGLFGDVTITTNKIEGQDIYLTVEVIEKPRLNNIYIKGLKKSGVEDVMKAIENFKARPLTEGLKTNIINTITDMYEEKSYSNSVITVVEQRDSSMLNSANIIVNVDKGKKVKINDLQFYGREQGELNKMYKAMKETKPKTKFDLLKPLRKDVSRKQKTKDAIYTIGNLNSNSVRKYFSDRVRFNLFSGSKFNAKKYEEDKIKLIDYYNANGFRDAKIVEDNVTKADNGNVNIDIKVEEGNRYYFRNIAFKGNSKYPSEALSTILGIKKGDVYNSERLYTRLQGDADNGDVGSLYWDDGYIFFQANPVETAIENDSIDIEIRISEGPQATIKNVVIQGNDKTNEHVIRRELRTLPGDKFSRSDLIRSQREIANLGFFDPQETKVEPMPNPTDGTVDIVYTVKEKSADQIELSAGWGGKGNGLIGTLGLKFNNFSLKNIVKKGTWKPLPSGDGQQFSIRVESNGRRYQNYNFSITEPWLGGKKPNAFTFAAFRSRIQNIYQKTVVGKQITNGLSVALATRLKKPDDFFVIRAEANYNGFKLENYGAYRVGNNEVLSNGKFNSLNFKLSLSRNSIDQPVFPRSGSNIVASVQFTPPYSLFSKQDYTDVSLTPAEKYKWVEYHKWKFNLEWYTPLGKKLVLKTAAKFGFLAAYNKKLGVTPFERFQVGGNGIPSSIQLFGIDVIAQRGYESEYSSEGGDPLYNKFQLELRYPISLNPSATIYGVMFAEGANTYKSFKDYNPFKLKKSAGIGVRAILPMFGLIGIDYGIRFDNAIGSPITNTKGLFNYIGKNGQISFILGFEPE